MTEYVSTRGGARRSLREALLEGLAPDGGLYMPESLPRFDRPLPSPRQRSEATPTLRGSARRVAATVLGGLEERVALSVVDRALTFDAPLVDLGRNRFVLELFHGPTHAFKDVGARVMASLLEESLTGDEQRTVLVATSGDTGGAVASACRGLAGVRCVLLFPADRISRRQRLQMTTLERNVVAVEVDGTFDDCQRLVKRAFADTGLRSDVNLTSANSINIARLLPQMFYYLHAAECLSSIGGKLPAPHFVVPSGNLGNLCAGLMAALGGMRHSGFTCAVNANAGVRDYLAGNDFEPRRSIPTTSSAMDVGNPSNLERVRWLYGGVDSAVRSAVAGVSVSDVEVEETTRRLHGETGYLADPHTAVGFSAVEGAVHDVPVVVLSTAHPAKFPEVVRKATGIEVDLPPGLRFDDDVVERVVRIEPEIDALKDILQDEER